LVVEEIRKERKEKLKPIIENQNLFESRVIVFVIRRASGRNYRCNRKNKATVNYGVFTSKKIKFKLGFVEATKKYL
jgi:DNA mismatch repair protein MutS2